MSEAKKFDNGKPPLSLIPGIALEMCAEALAYGAVKYSADGFKSGMKHRRILNAALRHIYKYADGEDTDKESGLSHISHALASLCMLAYHLQNHPNLDDRFRSPNDKLHED